MHEFANSGQKPLDGVLLEKAAHGEPQKPPENNPGSAFRKGVPPTSEHLNKQFMPGIRWHYLRHTCAILLVLFQGARGSF